MAMYSSDQIRQLQTLTNSLMEKAKKSPLNNKDLDKLRSILRFHEYRELRCLFNSVVTLS